MNIDPLTGKTNTGQKGLHNGTGNTEQCNGPKAHGDNKEGLVVVGLFHEESPEQCVMIWGLN